MCRITVRLWIFQSTFPRGERRLFQRIRAIILNFNPRSRVGNDPTKYSWTKIKGISIHVPAWGTTINNVSGVFLSHISIHVPAWGTTILSCQLCHILEISIHVPAWGTTRQAVLHYTVRIISIHVPAWGTTACNVASLSFVKFQSTFPRGERPQSMTFAELEAEFQSTFPRGERHCTYISFFYKHLFQSTFPRGERPQIFTNILCFFMQ